MYSRLFSSYKYLCFLISISSLAICINITISQAAFRTVTGIVTKVSDGDSIQVTTPEQTKLRVRLYGIDAPETDKINNRTGQVNKPGQPYSEEAWKALKDKIMGKQVKRNRLPHPYCN